MRRAFSLLELLVVVAILAILAAIMIPSLHRAKLQAYQVVCASKLKSIGTAILYYAHSRNGNGYLPQLSTAEMVTMHPGYYWTNQLTPYMKAAPDYFHCPADREPSYRHITGIKAGMVTARAMAKPGDRIEPMSYAGSCDTLMMVVMATGRRDRHPRKLTDFNRPSGNAFMADTMTDLRFCWTWDQVVRERFSSHPQVRAAYRRHYGGTSDTTNGPNWLFADGHVTWHSLRHAATKMICHQDLGNEHWMYSRMLWSRVEQQKACGGDVIDVPATRRGR